MPASKQKKSKSSRVAPPAQYCENCGGYFAARGIASHNRACGTTGSKQKANAFELLVAHEMQLTAQNSKTALVPGRTATHRQVPNHTDDALLGQARRSQPPLPPGLSVETGSREPQANQNEPIGDNPPSPPVLDHNNGHGSPMSISSPNHLVCPQNVDSLPADFATGDIKVEYHRKSARKVEYIRAKDFRDMPSSNPAPRTETNTSADPWFPFRTRLDFEFADLIQDIGLNAGQTEELLSLVERAIKDPNSYILSGVKDLKDLWMLARTRTAGFMENQFTSKYKNEEREYTVWSRTLWEWCTELLNDEHLIKEFHWDAEKVFVYNKDTKEFERRIDEPWTADEWWTKQSELPVGAAPFCIILYADKTHLSSFGTSGQKGYPVLARCANLPVEYRNSDGFGGARVVGWLPVVPEDPGETRKKGFVNHKRVVWHDGFYEILKSIVHWAKTGNRHTCGDGIKRWLFPLVLMISSDFEEQCTVAAIRGNNSDFPCPVCLVPMDKLSDLTQRFPPRTTSQMQSIYEDAQKMNATNKEAALKNVGLRDVENVFWEFKHTDIYAAISWDWLHAYHGGLFKDHLWVEFKRILDAVAGKAGAKEIEQSFASIPRYRGLHHFEGVMKIDFSDGSKWEDISKNIVYVSHSILSSAASKQGYHLLRLIRSYLELDMYASLTIHTTFTISAGRKELLEYDKLLKEYVQKYDTKSWNFPKNHTHVHLFDDIERKGATQNYNTKPNKKRHRPFKKYYRNQVNFKNIAEQILRLDHNALVATIICRDIDIFDEAAEDLKNAAEEAAPIKVTPRLHFGAPLSPVSLGETEAKFANDTAFSDLRKKIRKALSRVLGLPAVRLSPQDQITQYLYCKLHYECFIDSTNIQTDILRANPSFHKHPRYDYILLEVNNGKHIFAQLLHIFSIKFRDETHYMALVLPMDCTIPVRHRTRDRDLRFTRVFARARSGSVVVSMDDVVRGALVTRDVGGEYPNEFIVMEVIDEDLWFRVRNKGISLAYSVNL